jgi:hypothetical protein
MWQSEGSMRWLVGLGVAARGAAGAGAVRAGDASSSGASAPARRPSASLASRTAQLLTAAALALFTRPAPAGAAWAGPVGVVRVYLDAVSRLDAALAQTVVTDDFVLDVAADCTPCAGRAAVEHSVANLCRGHQQITIADIQVISNATADSPSADAPVTLLTRLEGRTEPVRTLGGDEPATETWIYEVRGERLAAARMIEPHDRSFLCAHGALHAPSRTAG